ncbi:Uncharacterised protein [Neisseria gonorrhoeae]|uniref:Uncharacterized protein n=1 Tax=Neisseria gonorrhoeae TaxID=485 RepID=A0A378VX97_NEIGO|nr:Uncharacterised protein [Neisseria gonorrhoeae]
MNFALSVITFTLASFLPVRLPEPPSLLGKTAAATAIRMCRNSFIPTRAKSSTCGRSKPNRRSSPNLPSIRMRTVRRKTKRISPRKTGSLRKKEKIAETERQNKEETAGFQNEPEGGGKLKCEKQG